MNELSYNFFLEIPCFVVLMFMAFTMFNFKLRSNKGYFYFVMALVGAILALFVDIMTSFFAQYQQSWAVLTCNILGLVSFILVNLSFFFVTFYLLSVVREKLSYSHAHHVLTSIVFILGVILLILNFIFHWFLYFDESNQLIINNLFFLEWVVPTFIMICCIPYLCLFHKTYGFRKILTFATYIGVTFICFILTCFLPYTHWFHITPTIGLMTIFINVVLEERNERELIYDSQKNKLLISQMRPHFIFNALYNIDYLYDDDPVVGKKMLNDFTKYLRGNLDQLQNDDLIPFTTLLDTVKAYLDIESVRFGNRVKVIYDITYSDYSLPTLILMPLVEDVVKYDLCKTMEGGTLTITSGRIGDEVILIISDDCGGDDYSDAQEDNVHNIDNIKARLKHYYPNATVTFECGQENKFMISIPMKEEKIHESVSR